MLFLGDNQQNHIFKGAYHIDGTTVKFNFILNVNQLLYLRAGDVDMIHGGFGGTQGL